MRTKVVMVGIMIIRVTTIRMITKRTTMKRKIIAKRVIEELHFIFKKATPPGTRRSTILSTQVCSIATLYFKAFSPCDVQDVHDTVDVDATSTTNTSKAQVGCNLCQAHIWSFTKRYQGEVRLNVPSETARAKMNLVSASSISFLFGFGPARLQSVSRTAYGPHEY